MIVQGRPEKHEYNFWTQVFLQTIRMPLQYIDKRMMKKKIVRPKLKCTVVFCFLYKKTRIWKINKSTEDSNQNSAGINVWSNLLLENRLNETDLLMLENRIISVDWTDCIEAT